MTAPTITEETACGCGRRLSSHYADQGRMRGPGCPDFHTECTPVCKHPVLRSATTAATTIQLAPRIPGGHIDARWTHPDAVVPARLREEPLPSADEEEPDEPAPPPGPAPEAAPAPSTEAADDEIPLTPLDGLAAEAEAAVAQMLEPTADAAPSGPVASVRDRLAELVVQLAEVRTRLRVSQRQLAIRAGLTAPLVNHIETGRRPATVATLARLADPLGHDVDIQLVDRNAPAKPDPAPSTVDVDAVRAVAIDMYPAWLCPTCHGRRHDRVPCCKRPLQPVWVAAIPREVTP